MLKRSCSRSLDKPILLVGLELADVAVITVLVGFGSLCVGPVLPGICGVICWVIFKEFKKDKPAGYLMHVLYKQGVNLPGLITYDRKYLMFSIV